MTVRHCAGKDQQTGNDFANSIRNNPANQSHLHASEGQQAFVGNRETHVDGEEDSLARNGKLTNTDRCYSANDMGNFSSGQ